MDDFQKLHNQAFRNIVEPALVRKCRTIIETIDTVNDTLIDFLAAIMHHEKTHSIAKAFSERVDFLTCICRNFWITRGIVKAYLRFGLTEIFLRAIKNHVGDAQNFFNVVEILTTVDDFSDLPMHAAALLELGGDFTATIREPDIISNIHPEWARAFFSLLDRKNIGVEFECKSPPKWWHKESLVESPRSILCNCSHLVYAISARHRPPGQWLGGPYQLTSSSARDFYTRYRAILLQIDEKKTMVTELRGLIKQASEIERRLYPRMQRSANFVSCISNYSLDSNERAVSTLRQQTQIDCECVFNRVFADACGVIISVQQVALSRIGKPFPIDVVVTFLRQIDNPVIGVVSDNMSVVRLVENCTNSTVSRRLAVLEEKKKRPFAKPTVNRKKK